MYDARVLCLPIIVAACLAPKSNECPGGGVCPPSLRCVIDQGQQLCVLPTCGNGQVDPGEACDPGGNVAKNGCSADCQSLGTCGNAVLDPGEQCDDGNLRDHDGCSSGCTNETSVWAAIDARPPPRVGAAATYDATTGHVLLFGGCTQTSAATGGCIGSLLDDTWEWDGTRWSQRATSGARPTGRFGHAMAYDASRNRVVLFGGCANAGPTEVGCSSGATGDAPLDDVWEWDGAAWQQLAPSTAPPARFAHAMAYDPVHHDVVLFGGFGGGSPGGPLGDTWLWDGARWAPVVAKSPGARWGHAMATDAATGTLVVFGGYGQATLMDTWEWNGTTWTERTPATGAPPAARIHPATAFDATTRSVVLFGGCAVGASSSPYACAGAQTRDTWAWDGSSWTERATPSPPVARFAHAAAYDPVRDRFVVFGGQDPSTTSRDDTWEWDGAAWHDRFARAPLGRWAHAAVYDAARGTTFLYGGGRNLSEAYAFVDTWEWDGTSWTDRSSAGPGTRVFHALAYDAARDRVVLFGGCISGNTETCYTAGIGGDTWEWSPAGWSRRMPATSPSPRAGAAMAYDATRGRVVLFGGCAGAGLTNCSNLADTWEWDGTTWTQLSPTTSPPGRAYHTLTYDPMTGHTVLFGGFDGGVYNDTWEWDGSNWTQMTPTTSPPARALAGASYDTVLGGVDVVAGCSDIFLMGSGPYCDAWRSDVWTWNGTTWTAQPAPPLQGRGGLTATYDTARGALVVFGGGQALGDGVTFGDTWEWDHSAWQQRADIVRPLAVDPAASTTSFAYDVLRGRAVVFDATTTWEWDGSELVTRGAAGFSLPSSGGPPPEPPFNKLAYDAARGNVVLLANADTWTWDGTQWTQQHPPASPPSQAVLEQNLVYDTAREQVVLIGLDDNGNMMMWAWDGSTWMQLPPGAPPSPRAMPGVAYDAKRDRIVLFGGLTHVNPMQSLGLGDTWEWDGNGWTQMSPAMSPSPRVAPMMVYDATRERVLLFGGKDDLQRPLGDAWEWDGTTWTALEPAGTPPLAFTAVVYDAAREQVVALGSAMSAQGPAPAGLWVFRYESARPGESCSTGFDADGDGEIGCADPNCGGVCDPLCAALLQCDAGRPQCGDGTCGPLETCRTCPADCGTCALCGDYHCDPGESCTTCPGDCGECP